jgi:PhzF family phenazine biosynthesis protein
MKLFIVDAFTDRAFAGNPAAVCLLESEQDDEWMQAVAAEMNLSETAFVRTLDDGFELRCSPLPSRLNSVAMRRWHLLMLSGPRAS